MNSIANSSLIFLLAFCFQAKFSTAFSANGSITAGSSSALETNVRGRPATQLGLFGGLFGKKEQENQDPSIPTRVFEIPCSNVKLGGCRFALGLFLIGQQGTPTKGTWMANQANDGVLDMFHTDNTAMFSVVMTEKSIAVDRYGLQASLQYQLHESLVLHSLLDEIQTLALEGEEVEDENRLIVFVDPETAIDEARTKLPVRAET